MEMLLIKPDIKFLGPTGKANEERIEISPLEKGLERALVGAGLRAILFSNIPGYAATSFSVYYKENDKYVLVPHEYSTIKGVKTDMIDIFINIKNSHLILKNGVRKEELCTEKTGPCKVYLGDFAKEGVEILNPDLEIAEITGDTTLKIVITIEEGKGYRDIKQIKSREIGEIEVDASFSPIVNVAFDAQPIIVQGEQGFFKVVFTVETNGVVSPKEAMKMAVQIANEMYATLAKDMVTLIENKEIFYTKEIEETPQVEEVKIVDLNLSPRSTNALKAAAINTLEDLKRMTAKELLKVRNLGKISFEEIVKELDSRGIHLQDE